MKTATREVLEKIDWFLAEMSIEGALSFLDEIADEIEERADRLVADDQQSASGGDLCARCGGPIDHNEPHITCDTCNSQEE